MKSGEQLELNSTGKTFFKQDCVIADYYKVVLWEEACWKLVHHTIIEVAVKMYSGKKYFTLTDNSSDIHVGL